MRQHELRKTLAWYSRGLFAGAALRQRASTVADPAALLEMGEAFFAGLQEAAARSGAGDGALATAPADPIAKSVARNNRRDGRRVEAEEPVSVAS
jgi:hypothetical protein